MSAERRKEHEDSMKKIKELKSHEYLYQKNAEKDEEKRAEQ